MIRIAVLVPKGQVSPGTIVGPVQLFSRVNADLAAAGQEPAFEVQLVGQSAETEVYEDYCSVKPEADLVSARRPDLIIVPATHGPVDKVVAENAAFLPWIRHQRAEGSEVASLCMGAFLLAATGLLEGRKVTTHWIAAAAFRQAYPELNLVSNDIVTDEAGVYTSGGALSFWNLLLYLVEKKVGREWAVRAAQFFEIEIDRHSQAGFLIFQGQKEHGDPTVLAVQEYLEAHYHEAVTVGELSLRFAVGRRSLERRFRAGTTDTVAGYLQRVRVEAAKRAFESTTRTVSEVMDQVGYEDPKAFRATFRKITTESPAEYRARYQRLQRGHR